MRYVIGSEKEGPTILYSVVAEDRFGGIKAVPVSEHQTRDDAFTKWCDLEKAGGGLLPARPGCRICGARVEAEDKEICFHCWEAGHG